MRDDVYGIILAGGQGSRLKNLTSSIAKPVISFGGHYRIIDFTLTNCMYSQVKKLGIITQYKPWQLNNYIGNGSAWGFNKIDRQLSILPPYTDNKKKLFFTGTADAILKNIKYIDSYNPKYLLVLSGDHIYKMNYNDMLEQHKKNRSDLTISVIRVNMSETNRFGIMKTNENNRIVRFDEKPDHSESDKASMGVYIFNWEVLRDYLLKSVNQKKELYDFGKNVIPKYLAENRRVFAYMFKGYWRDVGTVNSLWQANMDFLKLIKEKKFNSAEVLSNLTLSYPTYFGKNCFYTSSCIISDGCFINGNIKKSVISSNVFLGENSEIVNSVIMPDAKIGKNVKIKDAIIGEKAIIEDNVVISGNAVSKISIGYGDFIESGTIFKNE